MNQHAGYEERGFLSRRGGMMVRAAIILFWAGMMLLLAQRSFLQPETLRASVVPAAEGLPAGEEWWGIYLQGKKIGYAVTSQEFRDGQVRGRERVWLHLTVLGAPQAIEEVLDYRTDEHLALRSFEFTLKSGLVQFRVAGRVEDCGSGRCLACTAHTAGRERSLKIPLREIPYIYSHARLHFLSRGLEVGRRYRIPIFDPSALTMAEVTAEVEGVDRFPAGGRERDLFRVREELRGITIKSWIDAQGRIWKEESPLGLSLKREDEAAARRTDPGRGADLIALTAVPANREIRNPRLVRLLRARIILPDPRLPFLPGRQEQAGDVVRVERETFPPPPATRRALEETSRRRVLASSPFIQSDDPEIRKRAGAILQGVEDPGEKVRRLAAWVHREIEKRPVLGIPSAVEVLRQRQGDCNEHAVLFAALARAAGIPADLQAGIIYQEGRFYYHAWNKVHLGAWITVDPLLNQIPADGTHICLAEGDLDRQGDLIRFIGRLKLEILEVQ